MIILKDSVFEEILEFFDNCELHGRNIPVVVNPLAPNAHQSPTCHNQSQFDDHFDDADQTTVSSEARLLKSLFLKLYD
jgi:tetratricopeptide repeat protein 30